MTDKAAPCPELHPDHQFDLALLNEAIDLLQAAQAPRSRLVAPQQGSGLPDQLVEHGIGESAALQLLAPEVLGRSAQLHHPGYFAHMDPPTATITWASALWQAALNQNVLHPDVAPAARSLQSRLIDWIAPDFGMQGGHFTAGTTLANLTAMWAARECAGIKRVICSERAHLSIRKSADILGLQLESIPSEHNHQLPISALRNTADAMVVLTAGTVASGAIDPLQGCDASWVHVDAAWAGPLRFSHRYRALLDGIEQADSVAFSAHKWLFQPKGCALILFRDPVQAHESTSYGGGYLSAANIGLLGSAPATALPLAASLLAWGRSGIAARIESAMRQIDSLAALIDADPRFERWGANTSGVLLWRPRECDIRKLQGRLSQAWVSLLDLQGELWLRCVAANVSADAKWVFEQVCSALDNMD